MKTLLALFFLVPCLAFGQSTWLSVSEKTSEAGKTYYLLFDRNPDTYYYTVTDTSLRIDFYHTRVGAACADNISHFSNGMQLTQSGQPFPAASLTLPLPKDYTPQLHPFKNAFVISLRRPDYEKLWERHFAPGGSALLAPAGMALYQGKKFENLLISFSKTARTALVRVTPEKVFVEIYGAGALPAADSFEPESKFLKEIAFSASSLKPRAPEGVFLMDFTLRRKTQVAYEFTATGLKLHFSKS